MSCKIKKSSHKKPLHSGNVLKKVAPHENLQRDFCKDSCQDQDEPAVTARLKNSHLFKWLRNRSIFNKIFHPLALRVFWNDYFASFFANENSIITQNAFLF